MQYFNFHRSEAEFHLFSHTSLPSSHQRPQLSNSSPGTPRVMQFKRLPSPLSTPAITPRHSPVLLEQPLPADFPDSLPSYAPLYNALVLERLGKDLQSTFNQYQCGDDTAVPFTGTPTPTELSLTLEAKTVPRSRPNSPVVEIMPLSHPQGTDPLKRRSRKPLAIKLTSHFREKRQPSKHRVWTVTTIVNIGCQMLRRLEYMHGKGYVHRDLVSGDGKFSTAIVWDLKSKLGCSLQLHSTLCPCVMGSPSSQQKPDNFCVGLGPKSDTLYIIESVLYRFDIAFRIYIHFDRPV